MVKDAAAASRASAKPQRTLRVSQIQQGFLGHRKVKKWKPKGHELNVKNITKAPMLRARAGTMTEIPDFDLGEPADNVPSVDALAQALVTSAATTTFQSMSAAGTTTTVMGPPAPITRPPSDASMFAWSPSPTGGMASPPPLAPSPVTGGLARAKKSSFNLTAMADALPKDE